MLLKQVNCSYSILSHSSNQSRQCPKEITIADSAKIPILCVAIDDVKMNSSLEYHLSNKQAVFVNASRINEEIDNIVFSVTSGLSDMTALSSWKKANQDLEIAYTKKNEVDTSNKESSLLEEKLNQKLITTLMGQWKDNSKPGLDSSTLHTKDEFDENGVLGPIYDDNGKVSLHGVYFSLIDDVKKITVAYRTMINYNIKELKYYYYLERLDSITPVDGDTADGNTKKMFFVDTPKEYEELKILSFVDRKKDYVIINEAQLDTKVGKIIFKNA